MNKYIKEYAKTITKVILIFIGSISLCLGIIGVFIPLIPTVPFFLLTSICYLKSSDKLYKLFMKNKYIGKYMKEYYENKSVPLKFKFISIILLWISISYCIFFVLNNIFLKIILLLIMIFVTIHLILLKTTKN